MNNQRSRILVILSLIVLAASSRLVPHPYNLSPIGGLALFAGAQSKERPWLSIVPILSLFLGDLVLGLYSGMAWVYGAFILNLVLGYVFLNNRSFLRIASTSLIASSMFFLITNFGVWFGSSMYPQTSTGLVECYTAAIPFLGATIAGDLIFSFGFFGVLAALERMNLIPERA